MAEVVYNRKVGRSLLFYYIYPLVFALHIVTIAGKLFEKVVALELFEHRTIGSNLLQIVALLSLEAVDVALGLDDRDYRFADDKEG